MTPSKPKTIDDYLATVPADRRETLEQLRQTIHAILPGIEECISYSMPAFRLHGYVVAGFLATKAGASYYPFSGATLETLAEAISGYDHTKSAIHFDAERPLSAALIRKLLRARVAETQAQSAAKKAQKPARVAKPKTPPSARPLTKAKGRGQLVSRGGGPAKNR